MSSKENNEKGEIKMTKTAVIFARGKDIQGQIKHCKAYAETNGYTLAGVIVAEGRELSNIILGLGEKIDRVLVRDISRVSRNALECYTIQADLEIYCGALVEVAREDRKEEAFDRFMKNVIMAVKESETRA